MYPYQSAIRLSMIQLGVENLDFMTRFYTEQLGFSVLYENNNQVNLGIEGQKETMIQLVNQEGAQRKQVAGLYHIAVLLPSRKDLADCLLHFINKKVPLIGASDHGYSEAIYLEDPEGNGIEIYADRLQSKWDKRPDGQIIGVTEALDLEGLLAFASLKKEKHINFLKRLS
ncbi:VOC family protein [Vaginisenegalia massiliensis]|uniref:VOC family protein n=1 Tax=Vaginisenegalia massiliensis TaxID=2058294 RepID=UPI000F51F4FD|nr:VOC family protein [Vaginisenegalia massiliensis]